MRLTNSKNNPASKALSTFVMTSFTVALGVSIVACATNYKESSTLQTEEIDLTEREPTIWVEPETEGPRAMYYPKEQDILVLAKALYGECKNLTSREAKEAIAWCLLNRYDTCRYSSLRALVTAEFEVLNYNDDNEVTKEYYDMARDIIIKWHYEKETEIYDSTRTLPHEYIYYVLSPDDVEFLTSWYDSNGIKMQ